MLKKFLLFFTLSLFAITKHIAQEPAAISLGSFYQQPDLVYYDALEDNNKNIWLSTDNGLYKYDGNTFKEYVTSAQKSNAFFSLKEINNSIWMVNLYGQLLKTEKDSLVVVANLTPYLKGKLAQINVINNILYISSQNGLLTYNLENKQLNTLHKENILTTWQNPETKAIYYINHKDEFKKITNNHIETLYQDLQINRNEKYNYQIFQFHKTIYHTYIDENNLRVIKKWNSTTKKIEDVNFSVPHKDIQIYCSFLKDQKILLGTNRGIIEVDSNFNVINTYFTEYSITKILEDFQGNTWVTTLKNGVFIIPNKHFNKLDLQLSQETVNAFTTINQDKLIIGTSKGNLLVYNNSFQLEKKISLPQKKQIVKLLYLNKSNELLVSQDNLSSYLVNLNNQTATPIKAYWSAKDLVAVKNGFLNLTYRAAFYNESPNHEKAVLLKDKRAVTAFYDEKNERFFISYIDELVEYDKDFNEKTITYKNQPVLATSFTQIDNEIYIGTRQNGILKYQNGTMSSFLNTQNKLAHNTILDIKAVQHQLLVLTKNGLQKYDTQLQVFTDNYKYNHNQLNLKKLLIFNKKIIISGNEELILIPLIPNSNNIQKFPPAPILQKITTEDSTYHTTDNLQLKYNQKNINISFQAPGLQVIDPYLYKYRLSNLSSHWKETTTGLNNLIFSYLPSGKYDLEIKTLTIDGIESKENLCITFEIETPFWQKTWFYVAVFFLIIAIIISSLKLYVFRKNKKQAEELLALHTKKKLSELRLENIRSQMNPHFIFNALNAIQDYILSNEKKLASSYLVKFSRLIRMYLEHSQKNFITLAEELEALKIYIELEKIRIEDSFDFKLEITEDIKLQQIMVPSLFIQPYIENAIKHGLLHKKGEKQLYISFTKAQEFIVCTIKDNGVGVENSMAINKKNYSKHKSFALDANKERINLYNRLKNYNIEINTTNITDRKDNPGTMVTLKIPINLK
ncbi:Y_Y_Y domain-containing protein [Mesonia phycicola]|uniref:Y_Y_Y domain-containing protein n=1 Tax=Mesonia phycicola TaxID=579105 RepID=A0A1M6AK58_9FLAO|nr:histidine kinase [Mesonia phycicola]SHI36856.1 Y_Y_Y domain-containing protein [Mesonia phycicola]